MSGSLKFPIGEFSPPLSITPDHIHEWISDIETFPSRLKELTDDIHKAELSWRYRPGGWTIKQVVHHCADSHMNSIIRFKLALTEEKPEIRPYFEDRWAELPDSHSEDLSSSLLLLTGLHQKWGLLLRSLTMEQQDRVFIHPEHGRHFTLKENIGIYAWHCNHHLAHIEQALKAKGKYQ